MGIKAAKNAGRYDLGRYWPVIQWYTRKSHMGLRLVPISIILN